MGKSNYSCKSGCYHNRSVRTPRVYIDGLGVSVCILRGCTTATANAALMQRLDLPHSYDVKRGVRTKKKDKVFIDTADEITAVCFWNKTIMMTTKHWTNVLTPSWSKV
ncbi:hypothetical protein N7G274_008505 [Stereocaulon virgatum]|uniref:LAGLIDADG homing endonuclease n=1 Tax=Stereocaulon virgatum TaxID=373712 RepID=A0ABR4A2Y9_9LECA